MIKGRYVCQLTMDYILDESRLIPSALEELQKLIENGEFEKQLKDMLEDEATSVIIERQFADFYRVEDKD